MTGQKPITWDKSLYFFCTLAPKYDALWLVEEDVYIPSVEALVGMLHLPESSDLVLRSHTSRTDWPDWPHWSHADLQFPEPRYRSMVCVVGMSKRLVTVLDGYVRGFKRLGFVETFFSSIAAHENLTVLNPPTLSTVEWRRDWSCDDVKNSGMNWFHPIKNQMSFNKKCDNRL